MQYKIDQSGLNWLVDSAGTNGYHVGETPHRLSQKVALLHGIDISKQRARNFRPNDFEEFDHIYAMAGDVIDEIKWIAGKKFNPNKVTLLMEEVYPGRQMDVPDPWYGPEPGYHEVFAMIDMACSRIIEKKVVSSKR